MNHRVQRVRELIKRELSTILEKNYRFEGSLVTIHDVDMTPDLRQCFIYTGVLAGKPSPEAIIKKLNDSRSHIQRDLFKRVILKYSPSLLFRLDDSIERGVRILQAIENLPEPLPDEEPIPGDDDLPEEDNDEDPPAR
jgi:ribosome-binding factor A